MQQAREYKLIRTIAAGGMAQIYEARLTTSGGFERRVALKRMLPQYAHDPSMRRMFFDEARLVSHLHHGNIVQVLDFGVVDESEFIAFEYVDGVDAARASRQAADAQHGLSEGVILHIIAETAHALHYAHALGDEDGRPLGIIHRDVSPQNILLSWDGDVKLSDFGIALARGREERTRTGIIKGKDRYMAPEQAQGLSLSSAADIYALGVTLRELWGDRDFASADCADLVRACVVIDPEGRPTARAVAERAGALASRALDGTGRSALAAWLQTIRPHVRQSSKLDDLMGLSLIGVGSHQYTVSDGGRATAGLAEVPTDEDSFRFPAGTTPSEARAFRGPRSIRTWWLALVGLLAVGGALGVTFGWRSQSLDSPATLATSTGASSATEDPGRATVEAPVAALSAAAPARTPDASAVGRMAFDASATDAASRDASAGASAAPDATPAVFRGSRRLGTKRRRRVRSPRARRRSPPRRVAVAPAASAAPTDPSKRLFGWLRVGGKGLFAGRVLANGRPVGYAPLEKRLAAGEYQLVVTDTANGEVLLRRRISVGPHHTRGNPVRVIR